MADQTIIIAIIAGAVYCTFCAAVCGYCGLIVVKLYTEFTKQRILQALEAEKKA